MKNILFIITLIALNACTSITTSSRSNPSTKTAYTSDVTLDEIFSNSSSSKQTDTTKKIDFDKALYVKNFIEAIKVSPFDLSKGWTYNCDTYVKIVISTHLVFNAGDSSYLSESGKQFINPLMNVLSNYPRFSLEINVYTDNTLTEKQSINITNNRASTLEKYFGYHLRNQIVAKGKGISYKFSNDILAEKIKNRRIEIILNPN